MFVASVEFCFKTPYWLWFDILFSVSALLIYKENLTLHMLMMISGLDWETGVSVNELNL